jgi:hypothetical protein
VESSSLQNSVFKSTMVRHLANFCVGLASEELCPQLPASPVSPIVCEAGATILNVDGPEGMVVCPELHCRKNLESCTAVYMEYYGKGEFEGRVNENGLAGMDVLFGNKWRIGNGGGYQKAFSRMKQICSAVLITMERDNKTELEVLERFDEMFVEENCTGLDHLRQLLDHVIPKRSRAKRVRVSVGE